MFKEKLAVKGQQPNSVSMKKLQVSMLVLLMAVTSGCIGSSSTTASSSNSAASANSGAATTSVNTMSFVRYSSSQYGSALPAYTVTSSDANIKFFKYLVVTPGASVTFPASATQYPIGSTVSIDPSLLSEGMQFVYFQGVEPGVSTNAPTTLDNPTISLTAKIGDGYYVGNRVVNGTAVENVLYTGKRVFNNISSATLTLDFGGANRVLRTSVSSPVAASLDNAKAAVELSFLASNVSLRASGGYGNDVPYGGYYDRLLLAYTGNDALLPAPGTIAKSDLHLYKAAEPASGRTTRGLLNATGTLANVGTANPPFAFTLTLQTFDNVTFKGYLLLQDATPSHLYHSYPAVGSAGSGQNANGIIFSTNTSGSAGFFGFVSFENALSLPNQHVPAYFSGGVPLRISQMTIHSADILGLAPLDSYYLNADNTGLSVSMLQNFYPWPSK